jgi:hypothetical protein
LIATIARENLRWGSERIRGELLKLGLAVNKRSIQRYRRRGPARPPSQTWPTFLANHARAIWAADRCTVQTLRFKTLYVLILFVRNERHLRAVLAEFAAFSSGARPHRTLEPETPLPAVRPTSGPIRARPGLGGLHHAYERTA